MDWGLTGLVVTIIFGIVAIISIIIAVRLARKKKPVWAYRTEQVIGLGTNAPPELKLTFNNKQVSSVFRTALVFFNLGNEAIRRPDVTDNVNFLFQGADILREPDAKSNKPEIRMDAMLVTKDTGDAVKLDFEYLSHNDGTVIEVLHTKCEGIKCEGNIIDSLGIRNIGDFIQVYPQFKPFLTRVSVPLLFGISGIIFLINGKLASNPGDWVGRFFFPCLAILFGFTTLPDFLRFFRERRFPKWSIASKESLNEKD